MLPMMGDMDLGDGTSEAFDNFMSNDEDSRPESNTSSDSTSSSAGDEEFRDRYCEGISFVDENTDSKECITRNPDKLARVFFKEFRDRYCEGISFVDENTDSKECITRNPDKLARV